MLTESERRESQGETIKCRVSKMISGLFSAVCSFRLKSGEQPQVISSA